MARRSPINGTVCQRDNGRWVAQLGLPRQGDGQRRRVYRRARTRAEAVQILREMRQEFDSTGTLASASRTIRDATTIFEESKGSDDQKAWAAAIVIDGLGALRLNNLSVGQCDRFLRDAAAGKYGYRPIGLAHLRKLRQFLVAVLRNEVRIGNLGRNVAELSQLPAIDTNESQRRALTRAELGALLDAAHGSRLVIIDLMGRNGLRPTEARGLLY
ncbi:MAG: hypothetical protein GY926_05925 [bacterium]|nr:hypothetical protein [bacterium]